MQSAAQPALGGARLTTSGGLGGEVHSMLTGLGLHGLLAWPSTSQPCPSICQLAALKRWHCNGICTGCHGCQSGATPNLPVTTPPPAVRRTPVEYDASALKMASHATVHRKLRRVVRSDRRASQNTENGSGGSDGNWDENNESLGIPPPPSMPPVLPPSLPPSAATPSPPPPLLPPPPPLAPIAIVSFSLLITGEEEAATPPSDPPPDVEAGNVTAGRRRRLSMSGSAVQSAVLQEMQQISDFDTEDVNVAGPMPGDGGETFDVNVTVQAADPTDTAEQVAASVSSTSFGATLASYFPANQSFECRVLSAPTITFLTVAAPEPEADRTSGVHERAGVEEDGSDVLWAIGIPAALIATASACVVLCFSCYKKHGKIAQMVDESKHADMLKIGDMLTRGTSVNDVKHRGDPPLGTIPSSHASGGSPSKTPTSLMERVKQLAATEKAAAAAAAGTGVQPEDLGGSLMGRVVAHAARVEAGCAARPPPLQVPGTPSPCGAAQPPSAESAAGKVRLSAVQLILQAKADVAAEGQTTAIPAQVAYAALTCGTAARNSPQGQAANPSHRRRRSGSGSSRHSSRRGSSEAGSEASTALSWFNPDELEHAEIQRQQRSSSQSDRPASRNGSHSGSQSGSHRPHSSRNSHGSSRRTGSRASSTASSDVDRSTMFV